MNKKLGYISGIFLSCLLMLLTIGLPVAYNAVKEMKHNITQNEAADNPYSNTNEEKTPSNNLTFNEEYVHEHNYCSAARSEKLIDIFIHANESVYIAYHGELHCPPPNILS